MHEPSADILLGRRVMVVEDEYFLADELRSFLARHGATVVGPVGTVAETNSLLASGPRIDAATVDLRLRDTSALEIADCLKRDGIPFIFITGYDRAMVPERHRDIVHFEKPIDLPRITRALAELTRGEP